MRFGERLSIVSQSTLLQNHQAVVFTLGMKMISLPKTLALVLALAPTQVAALCANSETYLYDDDGRDRNCKNIRLNEDRRLALCQFPEVNLNCPQTCGKCCEDDPDYLLIRKNGMESGCDWLYGGKDGVRTGRYCDKWNNGRPVKDACPAACGFCFTDAEVTVKPSAAPSLSAPKTPAPTKSVAPSKAPSPPTGKPSVTPTQQPTRPPSPMPSPFPTLRPTSVPSDSPSEKPSNEPSVAPSEFPSDQPSAAPSELPSDSPSEAPSDEPSVAPSEFPSDQPSVAPSELPSDQPSRAPSDEPSLEPSGFPSDRPTQNPSSEPSVTPTGNPTRSIKPSPSPSAAPTKAKTKAPTKAPTKTPTKAPTMAPVATGCSADSTTYTWQLDLAGTTVGCEWLTRNKKDETNQSRKDTYCPRTEIKEACCVTCVGY